MLATVVLGKIVMLCQGDDYVYATIDDVSIHFGDFILQ